VSTTEADVEVSSSAYSYNVNGIRDSKTEGSVTTSYVVDSNRDYAQVLEEIVNGTTTVQYSYGHDLLSQNRNDEFKFYLYDGLGSTRGLSNSEGDVTDSYDYEAFGEVLNETGTTDNNYKFTGEQFDSSLDQYYLRARYYDQGVGRFTQQDTYMGNNHDPVSLHKYLYANADPVTYTDPTGNFSIGGMMTTLNTMSRLSNLAQASVSVFKVATGEEKFDAKAFGTAIIFNMLGNRAGKFLGLLGQKFVKSCNSFTGDTLVSTEHGLKPISEIVIGDKVWSYNEETGEKSLQAVVHLIQREGDKEIVDITLMSGELIQATDGHPFYVNNDGGWNWVDAGDLVSGTILTNFTGDELKVSSISQSQQYLPVFNITVDNDHTYYVGEGEVLNHNQGVCEFAQFTEKSLEHIFKGNKTGGFHHRAGGMNPGSSRVLSVSSKNASGKWKGAYEAKVEICDNGKCIKKDSTFFPDSWSKSRVQAEIRAAYMEAASRGKSNGLIVGKSSNGYPISIFVRNGEIVTAYPKF